MNRFHQGIYPVRHYLRNMDMTFTYEQLLQFSKNIFLKTGCTETDATLAARVLVSADLRGVDSHGVARLSGYVRLWDIRRVNSKPQMKVIHETPSTAVVDADCGLGLVSAPYAMQVAIEKAKQVGTGWVCVQNSNHFGIAGYHAMLALPHDMIGIAMTNASALVAPPLSGRRMLGTNPIAVAVPAGKEQPFVADFATTTSSNGKMEILQRKGKPAPTGWVQTKDGNPSTNPAELKEGGAMLPLGGDLDHGSHKGFILGCIVDIFSGTLGGANYGPWVPPFPAYVPLPENMPGKGIGHFLGAMRIDAFRPAREFKDNMDNWIREFKQTKRTDGIERVTIPGEPETDMEKQRMRDGIPLVSSVVEDLEKLGEKYGVIL